MHGGRAARRAGSTIASSRSSTACPPALWALSAERPRHCRAGCDPRSDHGPDERDGVHPLVLRGGGRHPGWSHAAPPAGVGPGASPPRRVARDARARLADLSHRFGERYADPPPAQIDLICLDTPGSVAPSLSVAQTPSSEAARNPCPLSTFRPMGRRPPVLQAHNPGRTPGELAAGARVRSPPVTGCHIGRPLQRCVSADDPSASRYALGTCWSIRTGFPSGSTRDRLAGPVVDSSARVTSARPCRSSRFWISRTSV